MTSLEITTVVLSAIKIGTAFAIICGIGAAWMAVRQSGISK